VVRSNPNFRNFLITQMISSFGAMAGGFLTVYALSRWEIPDGQAASFGIALLIGQSLANLALGFLADHKGHKVVLEIAIVFNIASFFLALVAPSPLWFFAVFALRGMSLAASFVSGMAFPLEFSQPQDRPTYIGLASTIPGITGALAPILAGILASAVGYSIVFMISVFVAIGSLYCMHVLVRDPRHLPTPQVEVPQPGD
jgi:MFS family permease